MVPGFDQRRSVHRVGFFWMLVLRSSEQLLWTPWLHFHLGNLLRSVTHRIRCGSKYVQFYLYIDGC